MGSGQYTIVFVARFDDSAKQEIIVNEEFLVEQITILVNSGYKVIKVKLTGY